MREIGGFFELELGNGGTEYHRDLLALNSARNAFEYILRVRKYKKVFIPDYCCAALLEPLKKLGIPYEHYAIDYNLEFEDMHVGQDEAILCINYFGIKEAYIKKLTTKYQNIIVDNVQAFFSSPLPGVDTFYSCRKFFGVPDGAYLAIDQRLNVEFDHDNSSQRYQHLVGRIDQSAQENYNLYVAAEHSIANEEIKYMSHSTKRMLSNIDYEYVQQRRTDNYSFLHNKLGKANRLTLPGAGAYMFYPLLASKELKQMLIKNKVYVATYWPNVLEHSDKGSTAYDLAENLISLPIDQRYDREDMIRIVQIIQNA